MKYQKRKLGALEVSPVGMGCMGLSPVDAGTIAEAPGLRCAESL